jgi:hypothetical protein
VWIWHSWVWLRHVRVWFIHAVWFSHAEFDFYTQSVISTRSVILTRTNVILTLTTVILTRNRAISTRRVWFWHVWVLLWHSQVWLRHAWACNVNTNQLKLGSRMVSRVSFGRGSFGRGSFGRRVNWSRGHLDAWSLNVIKKPVCFRTTNFILLFVLCWTTIFRKYLYNKLNDRKKIINKIFSLFPHKQIKIYIFLF